jgi:hypothetical protein
MPEAKNAAILGTGTQRLISLSIGALFAVALIVMVTFLFGTTQPHRTADTAVTASD